ncbi:hypothetical protein C8J57DRAFT_1480635 [Mycena rebaudengoi]|nr:hypothetical protein C8J57DRAFT_1480635 [Mycena rebaudengoi]
MIRVEDFLEQAYWARRLILRKSGMMHENNPGMKSMASIEVEIIYARLLFEPDSWFLGTHAQAREGKQDFESEGEDLSGVADLSCVGRGRWRVEEEERQSVFVTMVVAYTFVTETICSQLLSMFSHTSSRTVDERPATVVRTGESATSSSTTAAPAPTPIGSRSPATPEWLFLTLVLDVWPSSTSSVNVVTRIQNNLRHGLILRIRISQQRLIL